MRSIFNNRVLRSLTIIVALGVVSSFAIHGQSVGLRPGVGIYTEAVGFEGMLEGRFYLPLLEDGPGRMTASVLSGYSFVSVEEARKSGFILGAGVGYDVRLEPQNIYLTPGIIVGAEFSRFQEAIVESETAPLIMTHVEAGYEFEFALRVGLQTGLKMLFYTGEEGSNERSFVIGPSIRYFFGGSEE